MSKCYTCKNYTDCKDSERRAFQELEKLGACDCSGYEYEKPKTIEKIKKEFARRFL